MSNRTAWPTWAPGLAAAGALALGCACESKPKSVDAPRSPSASAAAASPAATGASQSQATGLSPKVRAGWAELVGREPPASFADDDERRFYATCLAFTRALHDRAAALEDEAEHTSRDPNAPPAVLRAVEAVQQSPPPMPPQDAAWCAKYTIDAMKMQLAVGVARQGAQTLQAMAGAMAAAHGRTGKLCPATAEPVPADLEALKKGPVTPSAEIWDAPTWRCMRFRWLRPLRFQYEVRTEPDGFTLIARGSPAADGKIDEYHLDGRLHDGKLELGEVEGRFLSETPPQAVLPDVTGR